MAVGLLLGPLILAPGSFDDRRELAIEVHDEDILERLNNISREDWENSHPLDLTDEGIFADLENKGEGGDRVLGSEFEK